MSIAILVALQFILFDEGDQTEGSEKHCQLPSYLSEVCHGMKIILPKISVEKLDIVFPPSYFLSLKKTYEWKYVQLSQG